MYLVWQWDQKMELVWLSQKWRQSWWVEKEKSERNKLKTQHQSVIVLFVIQSHNLPLKNLHPVISNSRVQMRISEAAEPFSTAQQSSSSRKALAGRRLNGRKVQLQQWKQTKNEHGKTREQKESSRVAEGRTGQLLGTHLKSRGMSGDLLCRGCSRGVKQQIANCSKSIHFQRSNSKTKPIKYSK